jgi:hypothetical protein
MWWLVQIEVPNIGEAIAYLGALDGVHQFFTIQGSPITEKIEAYTGLDTSLAQPDWWTEPTPPEPVPFWE